MAVKVAESFSSIAFCGWKAKRWGERGWKAIMRVVSARINRRPQPLIERAQRTSILPHTLYRLRVAQNSRRVEGLPDLLRHDADVFLREGVLDELGGEGAGEEVGEEDLGAAEVEVAEEGGEGGGAGEAEGAHGDRDGAGGARGGGGGVEVLGEGRRCGEGPELCA
ncbi:hypothetical protein BDP27DRAFT_1365719 [Rhodocollybia butyracea]|uniref:Uncharacterized protein n=1 Tax=Rhodocollybia butyracea TaxID=206335 RepID=A0A9P5U550_9AGAR|nr:hypothetical protein BDP27DRAFT_1365719 [Rhodocollybia butyracea]